MISMARLVIPGAPAQGGADMMPVIPVLARVVTVVVRLRGGGDPHRVQRGIRC